MENERLAKTSMQILQKGESFGEYSFFVGSESNRSARSTTFTTVYKINRDDFIKVIIKHPFEYQKFCMIRDQFILFKQSELLK